MESSLTTLIDIGDEIEGDEKWSAFVDGEDGFFYGIPSRARRVMKFNPLNKSLTEIGPDLGEREAKCQCGVRSNNCSFYWAPYCADHILKIDTIQGTVETLDDVELPETYRGSSGLWASGALAQDNDMYYMPAAAHRIMRLNPDNDSLSSVGDDLGRGVLKYYSGMVVGSDDCLYGIPYNATRIFKFDPINPDTTSILGEEVRRRFFCGNGVLADDGYIYAANAVGQVLKVDTTINNYTWIGDRICSGNVLAWGGPIVGVDKCMYWPPHDASNRVLKFEPGTQRLPLLVGDDLGGEGHVKWQGGALSTDGVMYCIPVSANQVLSINPFKELAMTMQNNILKYPEELGKLFAKDGCNETFYGSAVRKFGIEKVFEFLVEECLPSDKEWADTRSGGKFPLFMVAASCEHSPVSVIYHLLRRNVHDALLSANNGISKKRKLGESN